MQSTHRSDQASVSLAQPSHYIGESRPRPTLVVSQQQHDDQPPHPPAQSPHGVAAGGRDEVEGDAPRLRRPLLPGPEAQGAQTQVNLLQCWKIIQRFKLKQGQIEVYAHRFKILCYVSSPLTCLEMEAHGAVFTEAPNDYNMDIPPSKWASEYEKYLDFYNNDY